MQEDETQIYQRMMHSLASQVASFPQLCNSTSVLPAGEVFLAGGVVRDAFLRPGQTPKDIDLFISEVAFSKLEPYFQKYGELQQNQFGSYRWYAAEDDGFYYDLIVIQRFYNGLWPCRNIIDVLNQFDITINALAYDINNGAFFNPQNGLDDLQHRVLRAIRFDYPDIPVSESITLSRNSVLWFRYQYYSLVLKLCIEPLTQAWLAKNEFRRSDSVLFSENFFNPYSPHV